MCLFDADGHEVRYRLPEVDAYCWHGHIEGVGPGQRYGFRVHGGYDPASGLRCNPAKLLLDPYAKAVDGAVRWGQEVFPYRLGGDDLTADRSDSAGAMLEGIVVDPAFDWGDDRPMRTTWADTVIYEAHVKGLTELHPGIPEELRGTYAAVAHPVMVDHFR